MRPPGRWRALVAAVWLLSAVGAGLALDGLRSGSRAGGQLVTERIELDARSLPPGQLRLDVDSPWRRIGRWAVRDGQLVRAQPASRAPDVLVARTPGPSHAVEGVVGGADQGLGLAARYVDQDHHLRLVPAARRPAWVLEEVADGEVGRRWVSEEASHAAGAVVELRVDGGTATVAVDGVEVLVADDLDAAPTPMGHQAGLLALDGAPSDRGWRRLAVTG